ncbi:MAG: ATP synthase subunit alpha [Patescibacteria group bacterium]|nr:MAG: ATP synthase subunit alpha [Patescibacteria group bacterium]
MTNTEESRQKFAQYLEQIGEIGFVERVHHPVALVSGLPGANIWEVVYFECGCLGVVTSLNDELVEVLLFTNEMVSVGIKVCRTGRPLEVGVGDALLGNVIDPLGFSLDGKAVVSGLNEKRSIDTVPLGIESREKVREPLETGLSMVDFLIPLGKGQRELVIGDRNIGKTTFVMQTILSQAKKGTVCIYAAIGKKKHSIREVEMLMRGHSVIRNCIVVGASASDPVGYIFIAPYTAMTIAEYFCSTGRDVLIVLDDLTNHAKYYREIALISKKFPGRDSYPGDVFYAHARLLERAGNFKLPDGKTASITCLPVCETIGGDISGYIQTNLMSITDGHIFFDQDLYKEGKRPAINYFLSVTRVGRQTQSKVRWGINRELSSFMVLHSKTERFIHFGAEINEGIRSTLEMGKNVSFFFDQAMEEILSINVQILLFTLIWTGILKEVSEGKIKFYITQAQKLYDKDTNFRNNIDDMINSCADFNQLLGKVSAKYKEILDILDSAQF